MGTGEEEAECSSYPWSLHESQWNSASSCWLPERPTQRRSYGETGRFFLTVVDFGMKIVCSF